MTQMDLVEECLHRARFDGITYSPEFDRERLGAQLRRVLQAMEIGGWYTLAEIAAHTGDTSQAAISARLRDLRKAKFGGFAVERRRRGEPRLGLWEYHMKKPGGADRPGF
jgi:hypothetical protein